MRLTLILAATTMLAACGGAGPTTVGGNAVPGQGGQGGNNPPASSHTFVNPTEQKVYSAIGGVHSYAYSTDDRNTNNQYSQFYAGNASTARNSGVSVDYNPRDAIFYIKINENLANVSGRDYRFQDPVHRTDFGGARQPQGGVPDIQGRQILYLQSGFQDKVVYDLSQSDTIPIGTDGGERDVVTFFYQKPGATTQYVTYAGFVRNNTKVVKETSTANPNVSWLRQNNILERGAWAYGERAANSAVPITGTGTFAGEMLATMVFNPLRDIDNSAPTYFQWIVGNMTANMNFAANSFTLTMTGSATAPMFDVFTSRIFTIQQGAAFSASGSGRIDLVNAGGFLGAIDSASFTNPGQPALNLTIAGSSVDGAFFGPKAQEIGGGFRIVGGVPDERIDILGAFTGK